MSSKISLFHPLLKQEVKFYCQDNSTPEEILETLEVYVRNYLMDQMTMLNPFPWNSELKALLKGFRLRDLSPQMHMDVLSNINLKYPGKSNV